MLGGHVRMEGGGDKKNSWEGGEYTISDVMLPDTLISEIIAGRNFSGSKKTPQIFGN